MKDHAPPHADPEAPELAVREDHGHDGSIRETFESIVIAFVLAFIFRAFVVEAFVIPTGSMAPTLLGQHVTVTCPQCGYRFVVGPRDLDLARDGPRVAKPIQGVAFNQKGEQVRDPIDLSCVMCDYPMRFRTLRADAGDRILVLKYIYAFSDPRRWDVVVFKNPNEPDVNYIKRLVGLPGEQLWIVQGNIHTRPLDAYNNPPADETPWQIQRKTHRPDAQRAVWQPVYHGDDYPLDGGVPGAKSDRRETWEMPWQPSVKDDWAHEGGRWRWKGDGAGLLRFDFESSPHYAFNYHSYNLLEGRGFDSEGDRTTLNDVRVGVTVMPERAGLGLTLLCASHDLVIRGRTDGEGNAVIETAPRQGDEGPDDTTPWKARGQAKINPLRVKHGTRVELAHVDQSISLWVADERVLEWEYELADIGLSLEELATRPSRQRLPVAEIGVEGAPALLRAINLDRDLHYTQTGERATFHSPATILPDQFFCLGDNSPRSEDGRVWTTVDPWVTDVRDVEPGFVPRELMVGRAFFVYYPSSHQMPPSPIGVPNFGDMRFID